MSIVNSRKFYEESFLKTYAIGGFQAYNMEMIQGIAERQRLRNLRHLYNPHAEVSDMRERKRFFR